MKNIKRLVPILFATSLMFALAACSFIGGGDNSSSASSSGNVMGHKHHCKKMAANDPTCLEEGNLEYWFCIGCGECVAVCPVAQNQQTARFTEQCLACGKCAEACFSEAIELVGKEYSAEELFALLEKDRNTFERSGGGVTFSGGEPLLQADFLREMLQKCKAAGIDTAIESALNLPWETIESVLPYVDHVLCDLKVVDSAKHREATGQDNARILENLARLCAVHPDVLVRTPVIPEFNDNEEDFAEIAEFLAALPNPPRAELLPFHGICAGKYKSLNRQYAAEGRKTPEKAVLQRLAEQYQKRNLNVKY